MRNNNNYTAPKHTVENTNVQSYFQEEDLNNNDRSPGWLAVSKLYLNHDKLQVSSICPGTVLPTSIMARAATVSPPREDTSSGWLIPRPQVPGQHVPRVDHLRDDTPGP